MKLIAEAINLNGNYSMRVSAVDDDGRQLPFMDKVRDLTSHRERGRLAASLDHDLDCGVEAARAAVKQLLLEVQRQAAAVPPATTPILPEIETEGRQLREIEADAWSILHSANDSDGIRFVQFGGLPCEIVTDTELKSARPQVLRVPNLRSVLSKRANFNGLRGACFPPRAMLEDLVESSKPPLPELRGVVSAPLLAPSGELVTRPGFHVPTGYFVTLGPGFAEIPSEPGPTDLEAAREALDELLIDFPFVSRSDRTHAVAAMLTRMARTLIDGPTPLFDIEAPTEGSGKGLLAEVIALASTGKSPQILTEGRDEDEWRKRITANLVEAPSITLLDNLRGRLESAQISSVLTARQWSDRRLGVTGMVKVHVETLWLLTANNPAFSSEVARRVVRVRIDSGVQRPWLLEGFRHVDLRAWTLKNRPRLVHALLVLVRAWQAAGRPPGTQVLGSYEAWTFVIGGILAVAGYEDFLANRDQVYDEAGRQAEEWEALAARWWQEWNSKPVSVSEIHALAVQHGLLAGLRAGNGQHSAVVRMGLALSRMRDRVIGDWRLSEAGSDPTDRRRTYRLLAALPSTKYFEHFRNGANGRASEGDRTSTVAPAMYADTYELDEQIAAQLDDEAATLAGELED